MNRTEFAGISTQGGGFPPGGGYPPPGGGPFGPPGGGGYGPPGGGPFGPPGGGYGPPGGFAPPPPVPPPGAGGAFSGPGLDAFDTIAFAWNVMLKDIPGVVLPLAVAHFVLLLPVLAFGWGMGFTVGLLSSAGVLDPQAGMFINYGSYPILSSLLFAAMGFLFGGTTHFALRVARGEKPDFGAVFSGGSWFLPMLGGVICYSVGGTIGWFMCIVPGVIVTFGGFVFPQLIVDRRLGPIAALSESFRLTSGYRDQLFFYFLLMLIVAIASSAACGIGAFLVAAPMNALGSAYIYLKLTGEQPRPA